MRFDGFDDIDRDEETTEREAPPVPLDAAESAWDPWLRALYLRALAAEESPTLH